jgi:aminoglycoside/choline kinase family phosphotransferase
MSLTSAEKIPALQHLFTQWTGHAADSVEQLPPSGSAREYFRLRWGERSAIGTFNPHRRENEAFLYFADHFRQQQLPVPEVYAHDLSAHVYLQTDLGDRALLSEHLATRQGTELAASTLAHYQQALSQLARLQIEAGRQLDFSRTYAPPRFDRQAMQWDLEYFKYYFLRLAGVEFDPVALEADFGRLTAWLAQVPGDYFLYRDFQARNILLHQGQPWFIDFQGGQQGPLAYDVASLLYQAKAQLPAATREALLDHYLQAASQYLPNLDRSQFKAEFQGFVLLRLLQVLGAYGLRGFYERKPHFLESIAFALQHVEELLATGLPLALPTLESCLRELLTREDLRQDTQAKPENQRLTISIQSFSYKQGLPTDKTEHGGGFIFDCRALHNPGRYEPYRHLTGRDPEVQQFLLQESKIESFLAHVYALVDRSVETYLRRNFQYLSVSFGCTGGQHRSVYCADALAWHLSEAYQVNATVHHREQERKGWQN